MKLSFSKTLALSIVTFSLIAQPAFCLKLSDVVKNCKAVSKYWAFKKGEAFHCGRKAALVKIKGQTYEVSTLRVVGLENSKTYRNFGDLVTKLNLLEKDSETTTPYKAFPDWKAEVFNVNLEDPKATIILSLHPVESAPPVKS
ncbi:MAG: hypothetical protein GW748_00445 [Alphaproteobacteria bacterium]|nr:hypothetical protein [Alphaproteobacteria bacterium]NCQ66201.1 hypothetical protein [Alphaproteobacteria bacterium]NCT06549.1 hypothetical protein [Alphaproteobacteria bacterium]